ncbi:hypothetical protein BHE74_00059822 [Ensete ventricosum]|nr:hypothetical protein BHE74_00059822 [Ensete ventricosum]
MAGACRGETCGRRQCPRLGHRWRLPAAWPQGAAPWPGLPPTRATAVRSDASRGSARARRRRPPTWCRPRAAKPTKGAATHVDDMQHRRLRRAVATAQMGARGPGHPFRKRTILSL